LRAKKGYPCWTSFNERDLPEAVHADLSEERSIGPKDGVFVVKIFLEDKTEGLFVERDPAVLPVALECPCCKTDRHEKVDDPVGKSRAVVFALFPGLRNGGVGGKEVRLHAGHLGLGPLRRGGASDAGTCGVGMLLGCDVGLARPAEEFGKRDFG